MRLFADQAKTNQVEKTPRLLSPSPNPDQMALRPNWGGQQGQDEITHVRSGPDDGTFRHPSPLYKETEATSSINGSAVDPSGASTKHVNVAVSQCRLTDDARSTGDAEAQPGGQQDAKALYDDFGKLPQSVWLRMFIGSATALLFSGAQQAAPYSWPFALPPPGSGADREVTWYTASWLLWHGPVSSCP
jgi:hypothetical protein